MGLLNLHLPNSSSNLNNPFHQQQYSLFVIVIETSNDYAIRTNTAEIYKC